MLFEGKKAVVMGVAGHRSIATSVVESLVREGAEVVVSYLPDAQGKSERRVQQSLENIPCVIEPCDVRDDVSVKTFFQKVEDICGRIDFIVHSIAWAPTEDLKQPLHLCSRQGFQEALDVSVYSFLAVAQFGASLLQDGGRIVTLSYYGGEKVVPGYHLMGIAKAALESSVRYLAYDLGERDITVNAVSAGPLKTLASAGIPGFSEMHHQAYEKAPLKKVLKHQDVGNTVCGLLSHFSDCVTGEVVHVDCGYHAMA